MTDDLRRHLSNRIADVVANERTEALEHFADALESVLALRQTQSMSELLVMAALFFPSRSEEDAGGGLSDDERARIEIPHPGPVRWPLLVRQRAHTAVCSDTGEAQARPKAYTLVEDMRRAPLVEPGAPEFEEVDWLVPEVDDTLVVVSMFSNETELEAYMNGWIQGLSTESGTFRQGMGVAAVDTIGGPACVAWKPDSRNLVVWRDVRDPHCNRILAVVGPDGVPHSEDCLSDDLIREFLPLARLDW